MRVVVMSLRLGLVILLGLLIAPAASALCPHGEYSPFNLVTNISVGSGIQTAPAIANGNAYVAAFDGYIYMYNISNETMLWRFQTAGINLAATPLYDNGTIYAAGGDKVYAINAISGGEIWNYTTPRLAGSPSFSNDTIYFGDDGGTIYALNASDGNERWTYSPGGSFFDRSVVADNDVVAAKYRNLYVLNAMNGSVIWTMDLDNTGFVTIQDDVIYANAYNDLYAFNKMNGSVIWNTTVDDNIMSPLTFYNDTIYVGVRSMVTAINATDGNISWTANFGITGEYITSITLFDNIALTVGTYFAGIDGTNGDMVNPNIFQINAFTFFGRSMPVSDGVLYTFTGDGRLLGYDVASCAALSTPVVDFDASSFIMYPNYDIYLNDRSNGIFIDSWNWSFGNGETYTITHPSRAVDYELSNWPHSAPLTPVIYNYSSPGYYSINLTVCNGGGCNSTTKTDYILISPEMGTTINTIDTWSDGPAFPSIIGKNNVIHLAWYTSLPQYDVHDQAGWHRESVPLDPGLAPSTYGIGVNSSGTPSLSILLYPLEGGQSMGYTDKINNMWNYNVVENNTVGDTIMTINDVYKDDNGLSMVWYNSTYLTYYHKNFSDDSQFITHIPDDGSLVPLTMANTRQFLISNNSVGTENGIETCDMGGCSYYKIDENAPYPSTLISSPNQSSLGFFYVNPDNLYMQFMHNSGLTWFNDTITRNDNSYLDFIGACYDPLGNIHVAYEEGGLLFYAYHNITGWYTYSISDQFANSYQPQIATDNSNVYIAYIDPTGNLNVTSFPYAGVPPPPPIPISEWTTQKATDISSTIIMGIFIAVASVIALLVASLIGRK